MRALLGSAIISGLLLAGLASSRLNAQEKAPDAKTAFPDLGFSPEGRPGKMDHAGANIYLWHDKDGYHVKTTGEDRDKSILTGEIRVEGGKFVNIRNLENLERGKKRKAADVGWVSPEKKIIRFKFVTTTHEDIFAFDVEGDSAKVKFDLTVDGTRDADRVHIGRQGRHPAGMKFLIDSAAK